MLVDMMKFELEDFFDGVEDIISVGDFIEKIEGAQLLFV